MKNLMEAVKRLMDRWPAWVGCRCGGKGFWFEQIDGPDNLRRVTCPKHWYLEK